MNKCVTHGTAKMRIILGEKKITHIFSYITSHIQFRYTILLEEIRTTRYNRAFNTMLCDARILIDSSARGNPIHQIVDSWCEFHSSALTSSVLRADIRFHFGAFAQWSIVHKNGNTRELFYCCKRALIVAVISFNWLRLAILILSLVVFISTTCFIPCDLFHFSFW